MWIEIVPGYMSITDWPSRLARALWIEITVDMCGVPFTRPSRLARALWIEISAVMAALAAAVVEARESLVD